MLPAILLTTSLAQTGWPASGPSLCAVSPLLQIRPTSTCADFGPRSTCEHAHIDIVAQRGEVESAQLLLRFGTSLDAKDASLHDVSVALTPTGSTPPPYTAVIFQVGYVNATHSPRYEGSGGGWRPDPLIAIASGVASFDVPADTAQGIWFDLAVSTTAAPGSYAATLVVEARSSSTAYKLSVAVNLTIVATAMPTIAESTIGTAWSGSWSDAAFAPYYGAKAWSTNATLRSMWFDAAIAHRTPPDAIYLSSPRSVDDFELLVGEKGVQWLALLDVTSLPLTPPPVAAPSTTLLLPPEEYRTRPPHLLHRGAHRDRMHTGNSGSCANYTAEYVERLLALLAPSVAALTSKGLLANAYVYGFDECPLSCRPQVEKLFGAIKRKWPSLQTAAVLNWSPMPVDIPLDIWILQYQEFRPDDVKPWSAANKLMWLYHCIEPHRCVCVCVCVCGSLCVTNLSLSPEPLHYTHTTQPRILKHVHRTTRLRRQTSILARRRARSRASEPYRLALLRRRPLETVHRIRVRREALAESPGAHDGRFLAQHRVH